MTSAHLHLMITHLPIFGSICGLIVLLYGLWARNNQIKTAAYLLFIISAIGGGIAYLTGEGAEETVENMPGVSENMINVHEDFALYALIGLIALGIVSLISFVITLKKSAFAKHASVITLLVSLISLILVARTGYLGGQIRHTEINSAGIQNSAGSESGEKDND